MPITYRLVNSKGDWLADAHSIGYLKGLVADIGPGRYSVDEIRDEPGPSGHTSRPRTNIRVTSRHLEPNSLNSSTFDGSSVNTVSSAINGTGRGPTTDTECTNYVLRT